MTVVPKTEGMESHRFHFRRHRHVPTRPGSLGDLRQGGRDRLHPCRRRRTGPVRPDRVEGDTAAGDKARRTADPSIHRTSRRFAPDQGRTDPGGARSPNPRRGEAVEAEATPRRQCRAAACAYPPQRRARGPERPGLFSAPPIWYSSSTARLRSVARCPRQFPRPLRCLTRTSLRSAPRARESSGVAGTATNHLWRDQGCLRRILRACSGFVSAQPAWSTDPPRRMARMAWCALMPRRAAVPTTDLMVANRSAPQLERKPPVTLR